ncbi:hypothetical protein OHB12_33265 [Nocardia sp. NBC_01730]|uniref:hypothetical protein n=1 Tax=Nocardia sp. NBC_01730 TaxID=2975998 RepID=UPI002E12B7A7|nr:hypothetical protein OHB12_33265 [Nocardia sp. NBC_01730]
MTVLSSIEGGSLEVVTGFELGYPASAGDQVGVPLPEAGAVRFESADCADTVSGRLRDQL